MKVHQATIKLLQGDITEQSTDIIVNAANSQLAHGGGVARAIASKAGAELQDASEKAPQIPTGQVYTTPAGNLQAKYVVHAVGPVWRGGNDNEEQLLARAIRNSLEEASRLDASSISFPAISTGIYGFPLQQAATIILSSIITYLQDSPETTLELVQVVLFSDSDYQTFEKALEQLQSNQ